MPKMPSGRRDPDPGRNLRFDSSTTDARSRIQKDLPCSHPMLQVVAGPLTAGSPARLAVM